MTTVKQKILLGIAKQGRVDNPRDLQLHAETDMHNIVHVLYRLRKQGLVGYHEKKDGARQMPTDIVLTKAGKASIRRLPR